MRANTSNIRVAHLDNNLINFSIKFTDKLANVAGIGIHAINSNVIVDSIKNNQINVTVPKAPTKNFFASTLIDGIQMLSTDLNLQVSNIVGNQIHMMVDQSNTGVNGIELTSFNQLTLTNVTHNTITVDTNSESAAPLFVRIGDTESELLPFYSVDNIANNRLNINPSAKLGIIGLSFSYAGIVLDTAAFNALGAISNINNNLINVPVNSGQLFGSGIHITMPRGFGSLLVNKILNNTINLTPYEYGYHNLGINPVGIYIGSFFCAHSPAVNRLVVGNIVGNKIAITALNIVNDIPKYAINLVTGINIQTESQDHTALDLVLLGVSNISNNQIDIETSGKVDQARGISILTAGAGRIVDVTQNRIAVNAPQAKEAYGIRYKNDSFGLINSQNTSFNQISVKGTGKIAGIKLANNSALTETHSGFYSNKINIQGTNNTSYGIWFTADTYFHTPQQNYSGIIGSIGLKDNEFTLGANNIGIYALAYFPENSIVLLADPKAPKKGVSEANGGTSYVTAGQGTVVP